MKGELLWVYEGLTEYLGTVLAARSGLCTPAPVARPDSSRRLRPWITGPAVAGARCRTPPTPHRSYISVFRSGLRIAASVDFYPESVLIWLDVDTTLRKLTSDRKSMDDFCHAFYAGPDGQPVIKTYTFEDLVSTLNGIAPVRLGILLPRAPRFHRARRPARRNLRAAAGGSSITTSQTKFFGRGRCIGKRRLHIFHRPARESATAQLSTRFPACPPLKAA